MKVTKSVTLIVVIMLLGISFVYAGEACNREDVKKAVDYAVTLLDTKGSGAFPEIEKFRFCNQDYVWVGDLDGMFIVHPQKKLVGKNQMQLQDPKGKYIIAEMIAKLQKDGEAWVPYWWENPATKKLEPKCSYVKLAKNPIDGKKVYAGAGAYGINEAGCK